MNNDISAIDDPNEHLSENEQVMALKTAINEGQISGVAQHFDPKEHLQTLKERKDLDTRS
ncbi:hypothetical protein GCM10023093_11470 [Nemorincola caseinilytica]|uniref:Antitoxin ParD1/3/4 n=1 Tax=Nemorincola caseinilytica TaxID=2054315 RepID=A0ABP8NAS0_9BACT